MGVVVLVTVAAAAAAAAAAGEGAAAAAALGRSLTKKTELPFVQCNTILLVPRIEDLDPRAPRTAGPLPSHPTQVYIFPALMFITHTRRRVAGGATLSAGERREVAFNKGLVALGSALGVLGVVTCLS